MDLVISDPKTGKTYQRELDKEREAQLYGKRVGEQFDGGLAGLDGYVLKITGGTDKDGFQMRPEMPGTRKTSSLLVSRKKNGTTEKRRKTVRGNMASAETAQLNSKVVTPGSKPIEELIPTSAPKEKKDEKAPAKGKKK
ncbi:MAG: eS6 family ribosomal protein [Candidatus Micrarchaeota archaeon]|nr:eS6 family ribosomal protein [Candidatus Micrarchaeota archaeon]